MDQENRKHIRHGKSKKIIIIVALVAILISVFSYFIYRKEVFVANILKEKLKIDFKDVKVNILGRTLDLIDVKYIDQGKRESTEYTANELDIDLKEIDIKNRFVEADMATVKGLKFQTVKNAEESNSKSSGMIRDTLGTEKSEDYKPEPAKGEEPVEEPKFQVKEKPKKKNIFESFLEKIESTLDSDEDKTKSAVAFIDEDLLDALINEKIGRRIEWELNNNTLPNIKAKFLELNTRPAKEDDWSFKIGRVQGDTIYKDMVLNAEIDEVAYPLSKMEKNLKYIIHDESGENRITGELFVPVHYFTSDIDAQNLNLKLIPDSGKYLRDGKVKMTQKGEYKDEVLIINGQIQIDNMKLNTNYILNEILKSKGISSSDPRAKVLKYILERMDRCKIEYKYDSKSGKFIINTDLQKTMKAILKKDFFQIATEIAK